MRTGKISETVLKRSVLKQITYRSGNLVQGPAAGESFGRLAVGEKTGEKNHLLAASVSVKGNAERAGKRAFYRLANDMAAAGGQLAGMLVDLYLPAADTEPMIKTAMRELAQLS